MRKYGNFGDRKNRDSKTTELTSPTAEAHGLSGTSLVNPLSGKL